MLHCRQGSNLHLFERPHSRRPDVGIVVIDLCCCPVEQS